MAEHPIRLELLTQPRAQPPRRLSFIPGPRSPRLELSTNRRWATSVSAFPARLARPPGIDPGVPLSSLSSCDITSRTLSTITFLHLCQAGILWSSVHSLRRTARFAQHSTEFAFVAGFKRPSAP